MKVMDGSGEETQLRITVKGRRQYTLTKMGFEYGISSGAPTELLGDVSKALAERPWVRMAGIMCWCPKISPIVCGKVYWKSIRREKRRSR